MKRHFAFAAIYALMSVFMAAFAFDEGLNVDGWDWMVGKPSWFSGEFGAEVSSAYLATSGTICDNRPVASQEFDWLVNLGNWGWIDGYAWTVSALHDRQHSSHREPFNEFEGAAHYGYDWILSDQMTLTAFCGMLWNPQIGYRHDTNRYWGEHWGMSLKNPYVIPYWNALAMQQPNPRTRIRMGFRRTFSICEALAVTPSVETVWADVRRYRTRYGEAPAHRFMHGAFITVTAGIKAEWRLTKSFCAYCKLRQFDTVDSHARRLIKGKPQYYARRDLAIIALGVTYSF